jgi:hypothetical protein
MYTKTFESDAKVWIQVLKSTLNSGNRVGSARLYVVKQMIDRRLTWLANGNWHGRGSDPELMHELTMEACSRLCEFASESVVTASEKNIYIHIMIDLLQTELKDLPLKQAIHRNIEEFFETPVPDGKDVDKTNSAFSPPLDAGNWIG